MYDRMFLLLTLGLFAGCSNPTSTPSEATSADGAAPQSTVGMLAESADRVIPIEVGAMLPEIRATDLNGTAFNVNETVAEKSTVLVVYRGGWCPFCTKSLVSLATAQPELEALGFQIVAMGTDPWETLSGAADKNKLEFTLLSDRDLSATKALGLGFKLDPGTVKQYREEYKVDLPEANALPVPAVFLIDTTGKIRYRHFDPDYKKRLSGEELLKAARKIAS